METVAFREADVVGAEGADLVCRVDGRRVAVPQLLVQPGTDVHVAGDHGTLVIPRWLAIGLGLLWPLASPDSSGTGSIH